MTTTRHSWSSSRWSASPPPCSGWSACDWPMRRSWWRRVPMPAS